MNDTPAVGAVVLCGGTSRRLGGGDKTAELVGSVSILDRILLGLPTSWPVVCVGTPRPSARAAIWTREDPPGGGPLAAIAAGLAGLDTAVVVVLAGDQPFAGPVATMLADALATDPEADAVAARQPDGRAQLLLAAYRRAPLAAAVAGDVRDAGVYQRLARLVVGLVDVGPEPTLDVDTPHDLSRARRGADTFEA